MKKIELIRQAIYRDGGTTVWVTQEENDRLEAFGREHGINALTEEMTRAERYFIDGRIGSNTKGVMFDKKPGNPNSKQVDKDNFIFKETNQKP